MRFATCSSRLSAAAVTALALAGCGSGSRPATTSTLPRVSSRPAVVWLCRPGLAGDPCNADLTTTVVAPDGATRVERLAPARAPAVDCFYVYPTISDEQTVNSNLAIGFRQQEVAIAQASQFSRVCRVYAPVYRQITLQAVDHPSLITRADAETAYSSVLAAFRVYLARYNHGRGIVFIGHSQGALILIRLLEETVDRSSQLRDRLVSAILLGGNLLVPRGGRSGGDFRHIPACDSPRETGCVVAYSSFTAKPPPGSEFGLTTSDAGVGLLAPRHPSPRLQIMCVNPAAPGGGSGALDPMVPALALAFLPASRATPAVHTAWVSFPGEYSARCETAGDATWLQVSRTVNGEAPFLTHLSDPLLGLHILDVNIALGNLVALVGSEAAAYRLR